MRCAVTLGVFEALDKKEGQGLDQLSGSLKIEREPLNNFLKALEYLKLVVSIDKRYYNHPTNSFIFLKKHQHIFHVYSRLEYMHRVTGPACSFLEESIVNNKPYGLYNLYGKECKSFYEAISKDKVRMPYFDAFMQDFTNMNKERVTSDDFFSKHKKILDVGGSTGEIALSLANHHPGIEVTVLDFPDVLKVTAKKFSEKGMAERLKTYAGDPLKDLQSGHDCILFFHFLDIFSPEDNRVLFRNAYQALPSRGSVGIFTPVTYDDKSCQNDLLGPYFLCLAEGQGKFYTEHQITEWLGKEKFSNISVKPLPFDEVLITADKR
jgi:2-polyprenyl-3-methyl-5-hydroxy-6-metoxy-1,4-benzoquinol methylase